MQSKHELLMLPSHMRDGGGRKDTLFWEIREIDNIVALNKFLLSVWKRGKEVEGFGFGEW
ncbi:hypothetical protein SLEP1_g50338 [Rubroshorea leprosula]|uniref:Uncharacterized protein n=1 Tax=Rubroshorea leprosula TaxID=152421 RepID=A0AAV5LZX8_9ROSI|nr:hypothetical protein SLEP1_g50338 [Rubroshorea leprosula]